MHQITNAIRKLHELLQAMAPVAHEIQEAGIYDGQWQKVADAHDAAKQALESIK